MSQENVELVRRAWEAHARHDNETASRAPSATLPKRFHKRSVGSSDRLAGPRENRLRCRPF